MKNAILYVRVSTDEQAKLGYSLGHQENVLTKYCESRQINVMAIYREDFSAKNFERPEYQKLLRYSKVNRRNIDYVLITKWDRFSRNQRDALMELKRLSEWDIEVNAAEQWIDFSIPHNKMMLSIYLTIPEIDNDVRGINTKMGVRRSWKEGRWTGCAPKGYKNQRDHLNKPILVKSNEAHLVEEAFQLFATGLYDKQELRRMMWKKGLQLGKSHFPDLLKNVLYCGKVFIPEHKDEDAHFVKGIHEPIVTEALFDRVQNILKKKSKLKRQYENQSEAAPLRGVVSCRLCGSRLTSSASKGRSKYYMYYHCRWGCPERIPVDQAHQALSNYFDKIVVKPKVESLFLQIRESVYKENMAKRQEHVSKINTNLVAIDKKLTTLEDRHITDSITDESYRYMRPKYVEEMKQLRDELGKLEEQEVNVMKYVRCGMNIIQNVGKFYENAGIEEKQRIIGSIFRENFVIENGECRTAQENRLIFVLKQFEQDFKKNGRLISRPFRHGTKVLHNIEQIFKRFCED